MLLGDVVEVDGGRTITLGEFMTAEEANDGAGHLHHLEGQGETPTLSPRVKARPRPRNSYSYEVMA
jgi:hypothetical protein